MSDLKDAKPIPLEEWFPTLTREEITFVASQFKGQVDAFRSAVIAAKHFDIAIPVQKENLEFHRDRLRSIRNHTEALLKCLRETDSYLVQNTADEARIIRGEPIAFEEMIAALRTMSGNAEELVSDTVSLREARFEDPDKRRQRTPGQHIHLWRRVADAYSRAGSRLSVSPEGKFHRLIKIAHRAVGLDPPVFSTLRDFVKEHNKLPG